MTKPNRPFTIERRYPAAANMPFKNLRRMAEWTVARRYKTVYAREQAFIMLNARQGNAEYRIGR